MKDFLFFLLLSLHCNFLKFMCVVRLSQTNFISEEEKRCYLKSSSLKENIGAGRVRNGSRRHVGWNTAAGFPFTVFWSYAQIDCNLVSPQQLAQGRW